MSAESIRTAIIVSVVIGVLAIVALVGVLWNRRVRRSAKAGRRLDSRLHDVGMRDRRDDKDMETGVIQEPLPVYHTEPMEDERRLAMTVAVDGSGSNFRAA